MSTRARMSVVHRNSALSASERASEAIVEPGDALSTSCRPSRSATTCTAFEIGPSNLSSARALLRRSWFSIFCEAAFFDCGVAQNAISLELVPIDETLTRLGLPSAILLNQTRPTLLRLLLAKVLVVSCGRRVLPGPVPPLYC